MTSLSRQQAEEILFEEARILDDRRYDEWFAMLTDDAIYWVPCNGEGIDPNREISLVYDDHARLRDRIDRLNSGVAHAQRPPSRICRLISNVHIDQASDDGPASTRRTLSTNCAKRGSASSLAAISIGCALRTAAGKLRRKRLCL